MDLTLISDLHGFLPKDLPGGDLLIVAGDLTATDDEKGFQQFRHWLIVSCLAKGAGYDKIIVIAGNHDEYVHKRMKDLEYWAPLSYLCDSGTEFAGLKVWGSPWTRTFENMNPHCMAFTCETEGELAEKWALIPQGIDILITHSPPYGVLDEIEDGENVGSDSLIKPMIKSGCRWHIFGHIHEAYGKFHNPINGITYINASHVNERYQPVNKPVRIEL